MPYQNPIFWFAALVLYFDSSHQLDWCLVDNSSDALCKIERRCINSQRNTLSISRHIFTARRVRKWLHYTHMLYFYTLSTRVGGLSAHILYMSMQHRNKKHLKMTFKAKAENTFFHTSYISGLGWHLWSNSWKMPFTLFQRGRKRKEEGITEKRERGREGRKDQRETNS